MLLMSLPLILARPASARRAESRQRRTAVGRARDGRDLLRCPYQSVGKRGRNRARRSVIVGKRGTICRRAETAVVAGPPRGPAARLSLIGGQFGARRSPSIVCGGTALATYSRKITSAYLPFRQHRWPPRRRSPTPRSPCGGSPAPGPGSRSAAGSRRRRRPPQPRPADALAREEADHGVGPAQAEPVVVGRRPDQVGMAVDRKRTSGTAGSRPPAASGSACAAASSWRS